MASGTVYILDDDPSVRQGLQRLLRAVGHHVTAFATSSEFVNTYREGPGCLLLDLCLPERSGLEVLSYLEQQHAALSVILISGHADVRSTVAAMKHGAMDFLTKPFDENALLADVSAALQGSAAKWADYQERIALRRRFDTLTPREQEVCRLVAAGYLNKQTAFELGTAEKTVKVHRARVMSKLQVGSVAELVRLVDHVQPPGLRSVRPAPRSLAMA